jgi:hypothetical protein
MNWSPWSYYYLASPTLTCLHIVARSQRHFEPCQMGPAICAPTWSIWSSTHQRAAFVWAFSRLFSANQFFSLSHKSANSTFSYLFSAQANKAEGRRRPQCARVLTSMNTRMQTLVLMCAFEWLSRQILKFMKSPYTSRCRWGRRLPLKV